MNNNNIQDQIKNQQIIDNMDILYGKVIKYVGEYNNTFRNLEEKIVKEPKTDCQTRRLWYHSGQSRESFQEVNQ